jgi:hypothetical protein
MAKIILMLAAAAMVACFLVVLYALKDIFKQNDKDRGDMYE